MKLRTTLCTLLLLVSLFLFPVKGQETEKEDFRTGAVKTEWGLLFVWNSPGNNFILDIHGKKVEPLSTQQIQFNIDGKFFQLITVTPDSFYKEMKRPDDKTFLTKHQEWEGEYLEKQFGEKLTFQKSWQKLPNGDEGLLWHFDIPASAKTNVKKQTYFSLFRNNRVFLFGSIVTDTIDEETSNNFLLYMAFCLRTSDKPTDLTKLSNIIKRS
jgi:hypothetical protein